MLVYQRVFTSQLEDQPNNRGSRFFLGQPVGIIDDGGSC